MSSTLITHRLGIVIGRFAPYHIGHDALIKYAEKDNHKVLVLVGSATQSRNLRTPFSAEERRRLIPAAHVDFLRDYPYNDGLWIKQVGEKVRYWMTQFGWEHDKTEVTIYGARGSEWYLEMFPLWKPQVLGNAICDQHISATTIRDIYFGGTYEGYPLPDVGVDMLLKMMTPPATYKFLKMWQHTPQYTEFYDGLLRLKALEAQFGKGPHIATDSVVTFGDEVLVVTRGNIPGKGQFALPGGYLEPEISLIANAKKEVMEETGIDLVGIKPLTQRVFDHPNRAGRGRIVTSAYRFILPTRQTPKGGDDASDAFWIKIKDAVAACESFHDDHAHIIEEMTGVRG